MACRDDPASVFVCATLQKLSRLEATEGVAASYRSKISGYDTTLATCTPPHCNLTVAAVLHRLTLQDWPRPRPQLRPGPRPGPRQRLARVGVAQGGAQRPQPPLIPH